MHHLVYRRGLLALTAISCLFAASTSVAAPSWSDPAGVPVCPAGFMDAASPEPCLVSIVNGDFEAPRPGPWVASEDGVHGMPLLLGAVDGGRGLAAVLDRPGFGISQLAAMPRVMPNGSQEATYVLRFAAHGESGAPVNVKYQLRLVDQGGQHLAHVSSGVVRVSADEAEYAFRVPARQLIDGALLSVEFYRDDDASPQARAYVDDVAVILRDRR